MMRSMQGVEMYVVLWQADLKDFTKIGCTEAGVADNTGFWLVDRKSCESIAELWLVELYENCVENDLQIWRWC